MHYKIRTDTTHTHTHTQTHMPAVLFVCLAVLAGTHTHVHTHIHIYTHKYTHASSSVRVPGRACWPIFGVLLGCHHTHTRTHTRNTHTPAVLFVCLAVLAGLSSVYSWGAMERSYTGWPYVCALVSVFYPGIVMAIFTVLNLIIHHTGRKGRWVVQTVGRIVCVRVCVCVPTIRLCQSVGQCVSTCVCLCVSVTLCVCPPYACVNLWVQCVSVSVCQCCIVLVPTVRLSQPVCQCVSVTSCVCPPYACVSLWVQCVSATLCVCPPYA